MNIAGMVNEADPAILGVVNYSETLVCDISQWSFW